MRKNPLITSKWFQQYFGYTNYAEFLSAIDPKIIIGIAFLRDELFIIETQRMHKREVDYLVAMQAAIFATGLGNRTIRSERNNE
jgi:hypothetical protein